MYFAGVLCNAHTHILFVILLRRDDEIDRMN
jgi:hypothetical protein